MTVEEAQVFAGQLGRIYHRKTWSIEAEEFEAAALAGYVIAISRFTPPGDIGKYARAYMRGAVLEVIRQEARAHGLIRPHTRRCRTCKTSLGHHDKVDPSQRYCVECGIQARLEKQRIYNRRYYRTHIAKFRARDARRPVRF